MKIVSFCFVVLEGNCFVILIETSIVKDSKGASFFYFGSTSILS